jgi:hypothetical protein
MAAHAAPWVRGPSRSVQSSPTSCRTNAERFAASRRCRSAYRASSSLGVPSFNQSWGRQRYSVPPRTISLRRPIVAWTFKSVKTPRTNAPVTADPSIR